MWSISLKTFRDRWQLFVGAVLSVALGVALVQSAVVLLFAAGTTHPAPGASPQEAEVLRRTVEDVDSVLGISVFLGLFLTIFIISSTFAFTVAERRRELALLRLTGASRRQVRRLLLGEGVILGVAGTGIGVFLGLLATRVQVALMSRMGEDMSLLHVGFPASALPIDLAAGVGSAVVGVALAARRASRVRPLDAIRGSGAQSRVMTFGRWFWGVAYGIPAVGGAVVAQASSDILVALLLGLLVIFAGSISLQQLSPLVVPLMARLLAVFGRWSVLAELAQSGMRDGVRRTATTAGPLIVLFGLVVGLFGIIDTQTAATRVERIQQTRADLVVVSDGDVLSGVGSTRGVAVASPVSLLPASMRLPRADGHSVGVDDETEVEAVDPAAYRRTSDVRMRSGSLSDLHAGNAVFGPAVQDRGGLPHQRDVLVAFDRAGTRADGVQLPVVAAMAATLQGGVDVVMDRTDVPPDVLAHSPTTTFVVLAPGASSQVVAASLARFGKVRTVTAWADATADQESKENTNVMAVLAGLGGLYAFLSMINAVAIGTSQRKREFALGRVSGASRHQVVGAAVLESVGVAMIGLLLGVAVVALCLTGVRHGAQALLGTPVLAIPWGLGFGLAAAGLLAAAITSGAVAWSATRIPPVRLVAARE